MTRALGATGGFCSDLRALGADIRELAVIKSAPPEDPGPARQAIRDLDRYDWVVLTSPQGVEVFARQWRTERSDFGDLSAVRFAVVGTSTGAKLESLGLKVDAMPEDFVGEHVARAMAQHDDLSGRRVLLARAQEANRSLTRQLEQLGAQVDDVAFYRTVAEMADPNGETARLREEGADWITFTSGSTVRHLAARLDLPALLQRFPALRLASIGPETSRAIRDLGLSASVEATPHTLAGLVNAIVQAPGAVGPASATT